MNRGAARRNVFDTDADRGRFLTCLGTAVEEFGVTVESYCLMGNHYHLSLWCRQGRLSAAMQHLSANYTRWHNAVRGADGPLFRSRFHSVVIRSDQQLVAVTRYVHRNPLDVGRDPLTYAWSSCRAYRSAGLRPAWLDPSIPLRLCGGSEGHERLVRSAHPLDSALAVNGADWEPGHLAQLLAERAAPPVADVIRTVQSSSGSVPDATASLVALVLASELDGVSGEGFARAFNYPTAGAGRVALSRARKRVAADPASQALLDRVRLAINNRVTNGV